MGHLHVTEGVESQHSPDSVQVAITETSELGRYDLLSCLPRRGNRTIQCEQPGSNILNEDQILRRQPIATQLRTCSEKIQAASTLPLPEHPYDRSKYFWERHLERQRVGGNVGPHTDKTHAAQRRKVEHKRCQTRSICQRMQRETVGPKN